MGESIPQKGKVDTAWIQSNFIERVLRSQFNKYNTEHNILSSLIIKLVSPTLVHDASVPVLNPLPPRQGINMGVWKAFRNKGVSLFLETRVEGPHVCFHPLIPERWLFYLLPVLLGVEAFSYSERQWTKEIFKPQQSEIMLFSHCNS